MATWTHSICDDCWKEREGDRRPVRVVHIKLFDACCFCGRWHGSGIFVRHDPVKLNCFRYHFSEP